MSLYLLLLALQAEAPLDPPPLKVKPVAVKPAARAPKVNPTIIYAPAAKPDAPDVEVDAPSNPDAASTPTSPLAGLGSAARERLAREKQADSQRRIELRQQMAGAHEAIAKALATAPLDLTALKSALERRDRLMAQARSNVTDAVIALLGDIPADERTRVAKALIERDSARPSQPSKPQPKADPAPAGR